MTMKNEFYEKTIDKKEIYEGKIIDVSLLTVQLPDGSKSKREIVKHPGGVAVIAFKDKDTILFVQQFRKPFEKVIIELPAGKIDNGEEPEICGRRELEEETGYKPNKFTFLGKVFTSPGFCNECVYLYKAEELSKGSAIGDERGFINVREINIAKAKEMIKNGEITDAKTICTFAFLNL